MTAIDGVGYITPTTLSLDSVAAAAVVGAAEEGKVSASATELLDQTFGSPPAGLDSVGALPPWPSFSRIL